MRGVGVAILEPPFVSDSVEKQGKGETEGGRNGNLGTLMFSVSVKKQGTGGGGRRRDGDFGTLICSGSVKTH